MSTLPHASSAHHPFAHHPDNDARGKDAVESTSLRQQLSGMLVLTLLLLLAILLRSL